MDARTRILDHLAVVTRQWEPGDNAPLAACAKGIAQALGFASSTVKANLGRLREEGRVVATSARVAGLPRRRLAYRVAGAISSVGPPVPFVGRAAELRRLRDVHERGGAWAITGPPGIGKTRLAIEGAREAAGHSQFWFYRMGPQSSPKMFLLALAEHLARNGDVALAAHARRAREIDPQRARRLLHDALATRQTLVVIDDVHRAPASTRPWLSLLAESATEGRCTLFLVGRTLDEVRSACRARVDGERLPPLEAIHVRSILRSRGVPEEEASRLAWLAGGSPFVATHLTSAAPHEERHLRKVAHASVRMLPDAERGLLARVAIRRLAPPAAHVATTADELDALARLVAMGFLLDVDGRCFLHDLTRAGVLGMLSAEDEVALHAGAASSYERMGAHDDLLEAIHHWVHAGEDGLALALADRHAIAIGLSGRYRELAAALDGIHSANLSTTQQGWLMLVRARAKNFSGAFAKAQRAALRARQFALAKGLPELEAEATIVAVNAWKKLPSFHKALLILAHTQARTRAAGLPTLAFRLRASRGMALMDLGRTEEAYETLVTCAEDDAGASVDALSRLSVQNNLALCQTRKGDPRDALRRFEDAIVVARDGGLSALLAVCHRNALVAAWDAQDAGLADVHAREAQRHLPTSIPEHASAVMVELGRHFRRHGDEAQAREWFDAALREAELYEIAEDAREARNALASP